ncbi:MAG: molybdate ABC transporter substrate-binding protein [Planctomycetota bacterium]
MNVFRAGKRLLPLAMVVVTIGCKPDLSDQANSARSTAADQAVVTVFAAASTTNAMDAVKMAFVDKTGIQVQTSYAASSTLAQQIANGAEADVFLSANMDWADFVENEVAVAKRRDLLGNRLVIIVPIDSDLRLEGPENLLGDKVEYLALGDPDAVPAGKYAKQALIELGLWGKLKGKVAAAKDVRRALTYVETGAAEAGIVYVTDAVVSNKVKVAIEIPSGLTGPVRYPVLLLKRPAGNESVQAFHDYLLSPEASRIFEKFGFAVLAGTGSDTKPASPVPHALEL